MLLAHQKKRLRTLQDYIRNGIKLNQEQQTELLELLEKRDFEIRTRGHEG